MKISIYPQQWLILALTLSLAAATPLVSTAADKITGTYKFEGKAKAKDTADGSTQTRKYSGKMRVGRRTVSLQIPLSVDGKVVVCRKMIKAKLNKSLKRNPNRANRKAKFVDAACKGSAWTGSLRLRWLAHPEGYALAFSMGGINDEVLAEKVTGKFKGSTGTLSTEENQPEVPEVPVVE